MSKGKLISYFGPMYAGKSTALINHIINNNINQYSAYKPKIDNRYSANKIQTHDGKSLECTSIDNISEINLKKEHLILIDEIQFFNDEIVKGDVIKFISNTLSAGHTIVVGGLDKDWQGNFFPISQKLIKMSDEFIYLNARCFCCGERAEFSYKKVMDNTVVSVGGSELYEARCIKCWNSRKVA